VQVPDDLGVAVGVLVQRLVSHINDGRNEASKSRNDRHLLIKELNTLSEEKVGPCSHPQRTPRMSNSSHACHPSTTDTRGNHPMSPQETLKLKLQELEGAVERSQQREIELETQLSQAMVSVGG
jgi:hypothetical protein